jgi:hypothetical protein
MRYRFTLVLLILNLLVFGLIGYNFWNPNSAQLSVDSLQDTMQSVLADPTRIELISGGLAKPISLERVGIQWQFAAPDKWAANPFAVNNLINQLQFLEIVASFSVDEIEASQQSLQDYGLESPQMTIKAESTHQAIAISVGTQTADGNTVYLLGPQKENIYVVKVQLLENLVKNIQTLKSRQIFSIPQFELEELHFDYKDPNNQPAKIKLERTHDEWIFTTPISAAADQDLVRKTLNEITNLHLSNFTEVSELNNRPFSFEDSQMRLTLVGHNRYQTLLIGPETSDQSRYYAKLADSSVLFTLKKPLLDRLIRMDQSLRDRFFMRDLPTDLQAIQLISGTRQLRLQRLETGEWQTLSHTNAEDTSPTARAADLALISNLVQKIQTLSAKNFATDKAQATDLKSYGFDEARLRIELIGNAKNTTTLLLAHPPENESQLFAKRLDKKSIYEVDRNSILPLIPLNDYNYWSRYLTPLPESAKIVKLCLKSFDGSRTFFDFSINEMQTDWTLLRQELSTQKSNALQELLQTIRKPIVEQYKSKEFQTTTYKKTSDANDAMPWNYRLTAHIDLPAGDSVKRSTREFMFSDRLAGTIQIGGSPQDNCTFLLPRKTITALYTFTDTMLIPAELEGHFEAPSLPFQPLNDPEPIQKP